MTPTKKTSKPLLSRVRKLRIPELKTVRGGMRAQSGPSDGTTGGPGSGTVCACTCAC
jgi:hypothetical protein